MDLKPIAVRLETSHDEYLTQRCASFVTALQINQQIMRSNPVDGRNANAGLALNWVDDVKAWNGQTSKEALQFVGAYLDAFGPVTVPTKVTQMPLYVSDKSTCLTDKQERT
jgi:hypothetical protein